MHPNAQAYRRQVDLLLHVLPEVAKEPCFALHGGTAINLFIRDMPRLSVDIDLTYVPIEERAISLASIQASLSAIQARLERTWSGIRIQHKEATGKLLISLRGITVKLEVNLVGRGMLADAEKRSLCQRAQTEYDAFLVMPMVPFGQLYGGKICAALDRQHPRDLFDIKLLFEHEGLSKEVISGFLLALVSQDRPIHEVLQPHLLDQRQIMSHHFAGMTAEPFTYDEFESTRHALIARIQEALTAQDKQFLLSVHTLTPNWSLYHFESFPAVRWKLHHLNYFKNHDPLKYQQQLQLLANTLEAEAS